MARSHKGKAKNVIDIEQARAERRKKRAEAAAKRGPKPPAAPVASPRRAAQKNRRRLVYLLVFLAILLVAGSSIFRIIDLKAEERKAQQDLEALEKTRARLQEELSRVDSEEYIEQQARQQLRMIFPGETLYVLAEPAEEGQ